MNFVIIMLILITSNVIKDEHYKVLQEALHKVDRLHIKLHDSVYYSSFENEVKQIIQRIIPNEDSSLKEKITIHINEFILNKLSKESIDDIELMELNYIHISEKLYNQYQSNIENNLNHQYNITTSVHHLNIYENYDHFSYLIYGPVFESISKINYLPQKTLKELRAELQRINKEIGIPIIGVGGITINNFKEAMDAGFSGVALRGHIWESNNPLQTLNQFVDEWKRYKDQ